MKNTYWLVSLTASLLMGGAAVAQTQTRLSALDTATTDTIAVSVNDSAKTSNLADAVDNPTPTGDATPDHETLAQLARHRPGVPYPRRGGYAGRGYPSAWSSPGDPRHTLIGLAIGFGLGAALGAKGNKDTSPGAGVRAAVLFGAFGGLIGAAIGHGPPPFYARNGRHHHRDAEDEEAANSNRGPARQTAVSGTEPSRSNADQGSLHSSASEGP